MLIVYYIAEFNDDCLQRDIANYYFASKKMINFSIKNLQIQGYTVLIKGENKKSGIFFLTELGQEFVRKNITQLFVLENNVFNEFSPEESKQLTQLLKKIPFAFSQKSAAEFCNPKILRTAKGK